MSNSKAETQPNNNFNYEESIYPLSSIPHTTTRNLKSAFNVANFQLSLLNNLSLHLTSEDIVYLETLLHNLILFRGTNVIDLEDANEIRKDAYTVGQIELLQNLLHNHKQLT